MTEKTISYEIETEIPSSYLRNLFEFMQQKYIIPQKNRFADASTKTVDGDHSLVFDALDQLGRHVLSVEIRGSKPLVVRITKLHESVSEAKIEEVKQDIIIAEETFEENVRESTLFFAWREGEQILPEQVHGNEKKSLNRLFLETQILLFVLFISLGMVLFLFVGWLAPIALMAIQLVFVFFSNKLIARTADWHITESNPTIHLLEYHLPVEQHEDLLKNFPKEKLASMKKEIYDKTLAKNGNVDCETVEGVFAKYGFTCSRENLESKKVNVYEMVKKTTEKFGFPMPEVVVSNTFLPNAAASGPSPSRGIVLITTGLLVQLEEDEIVSVLGHELGHLKGRDPLLLYGLTAAEFLFRFYVLFPLFPSLFISYFFLLYFWAVMTVIYFIAKFFEARADLVSAMVIGQPQVLAEALEKIGFKRLLYERIPSYRFQEWISLEPHPPIYFRVSRLEKLVPPVKIKHPLLQSAKDVIKGFLASF